MASSVLQVLTTLFLSATLAASYGGCGGIGCRDPGLIGMDIPPLDDFEPSAAVIIEDFIDRQTVNPPGFTLVGDSARVEMLEDGLADDLIEAFFVADEGTTIADYTLSTTVNNTQVLADSDVNTDYTNDSQRTVNITSTVDFRNFPGVTSVLYEATTGSPPTVAFTLLVEYTVVGIVIHKGATPVTAGILSGSTGTGIVHTYQEVSDFPNSSFIPELFVAIGWEDGCTTFSAACVDTHLDEILNMGFNLSSGALYNWNTTTATTPDCDPLSGEFDAALNTVTLPTNCPVSTALATGQADNLALGIALRPYKVGDSVITFTVGTGEGPVETTLDITVTGERAIGPPVVTMIEPVTIFRAAGGQLITLTGYNLVDGAFTLRALTPAADVINMIYLNGSFVNDTEADLQTVLFRSAPGSGTDLPYQLLTSGNDQIFVDLTDPTYTFNYAGSPVLESIDPTQGVVGDEVTLRGSFPSFNSTAFPGVDTVLFNGNVVPGLEIVSFNTEEIVFVVPEQPAASIFAYDISVQIGANTEPSNSLVFTYAVAPLIAQITGFNVQLNLTTDRYEYQFGGPNPVFTATVSGNIDGLTYEWEMLNGASVITSSTSPQFTIRSELITQNVLFRITLLVTNNLGLTDEDQVELVSRTGAGNGITATTIQPLSRTRSTPSTPLFVSSSLSVFNIAAGSKIAYTWSYNGVSYTAFNNTAEPSLRLLGRTFVVPNCFLEPGNHTIGFTARVTPSGDTVQSPVSVEITEAPLVSRINGGLLRETVNFNRPKTVDGLSSFDPDILSCDCNGFSGTLAQCQNRFIQYNWSSCEYSSDQSFVTGVLDCSNIIANSRASTNEITSADLISLRQGLEVGGILLPLTTYVRLSLTVTSTKDQFGQDNRVGVSLYTMVLPQADTTAEGVRRITLVGQNGVQIDPAVVKNWERMNVQVTPLVGSTPSWGYGVSSPVDQQNLLDSAGALVVGDAFWVPVIPDQSLQLGINGKRTDTTGGLVMTPFTQYEMLLTDFKSGDNDENNIEFGFSTLENPVLEFPDIEVSTGDENTIFTVSASSTVKLADFIIRFMLDDVTPSRPQGERVEVSCMGECAGANVESFSMLVPGTYRVTAQLWDTTGSFLFDSEPNAIPITVTTTLTNQETIDLYQEQLVTCLDLGDTGCLSYLIAASDAVLALGSRRREQVAVAVRQNIDVRAILELQMNAITAPVNNNIGSFDSAQAQSFIGQLLTVGADPIIPFYTSELLQQSMLNVLTILEGQVSRDQPNSYLQNLQSLLPRFERIALNLGNGGSSRRRLLQATINNDLLDVQSLTTQVFPNALIQSSLCGEAAKSGQTTPSGDVGEITVVRSQAAKICSESQLVDLSTAEASFSSCGTAGATNNNPKVLFLLETRNYLPDAGYVNDINTDVLANTGFSGFLGYDDSEPTSVSSCYTTTLAQSTTNPRAAQGYVIQNEKSFPGADCGANCYTLNSQAVQASSFTPTDMTVSSRLAGLIGGFVTGDVVPIETTAPEGPTPSPDVGDRGGGGLSGGAIAGIVIGSILGLLLLILLAALCFARCCVPVRAGGVRDDGHDFEYVERDVYGRGYIMDQGGAASEQTSGVMSFKKLFSSQKGKNPEYSVPDLPPGAKEPVPELNF
eukprot:CAMPEP_0174909158 /NCGR_PEP_ID=MMETSP0167-20121228/67292_1 /TAXON_ID=38298 /ORGANISM="Rhodella maculata, Strain CCMP736" /LENGTH=1628 /DNA_ID=CAMNT_0016153069 /DNA_START=111 /DNA_END=4997 /DNA_ORIENTATION=-